MDIEDYVSFETAILLKEKEFHEETIACYDKNDGELLDIFKDTYNRVEPQDWNGLTQDECNKIGLGNWYKNYSAPTLQEAIKWIKDTYNYQICIILDSYVEPYNNEYYILIRRYKDKFEEISPCKQVYFKTFEKAADTAIKYCLENLI